MVDLNVYRRLQQHLHSFPVGFPSVASGTEIRLLQHLFTPVEAKAALDLPFIPTAKKYLLPGLLKHVASEAEVNALLETMYKKGLVDKTHMKGEIAYSLAQYAIGSFEYQVDRMTPEFARDTVDYLNEGLSGELTRTGIPQLRTIPIHKSLTPENRVATYDQAETLVMNQRGPFAVANCVCRQSHDLAGEPCSYTKIRESCLLFGPTARHWVDMGIARLITQEESLALLQQAQDDGLVLQPTNSQRPVAICCCCGCCCGLLKAARKMPKPVTAFASNFYASITDKKCVGCKLCMKRCHMEAIYYQDKKCLVNLDRCIGCGVCVPVCNKKAIVMQDKAYQRVPYKNLSQLYLQIWKRKIGWLGLMKVFADLFWIRLRGLVLKKLKADA